MTKQPAGLLSVLLDPGARSDERDDAALDLGDYDDPLVEAALFVVALKPDTPDVVVASCGESLGRLWARRGTDSGLLTSLPLTAAREAIGILERSDSNEK